MAIAICTGLEKNQVAAKILSLYPNPNTGNFVIRTENQDGSHLVTIYNVLGAKVYSLDAGNTSEIQVNASLPEGVYYVELSSNNQKQVKQMIITK